MKRNSKSDLIAVAARLGCYITQDRDGFVQVWKHKPEKNLRRGIWESADDPYFSPDNPFLNRYTQNWTKSLITPKTQKYLEVMEEENED